MLNLSFPKPIIISSLIIIMAFKPKNLLLIVQLSQTLAYINNFKSKIKDFSSEAYKINYDSEVDHYKLLFRNGRPQFLEYLFNIDKDKIDVGVWSCLDSNLTQKVSQKYFGRYYRDLLFVLSTNRGLYTSGSSTQPQDPIKVPKDLNSVYTNFPGYNSTNTLVLTSIENGLAEHAKNDMFIPPFSPKYLTFQQDVGCLAVAKYIRGIAMKLKDQTVKDVRNMNTGKPLDNLYRRLSNGVYSKMNFN